MNSEKKLRELLWLNHGCSISCLYGDDGEMQCNNAHSHRPIDFKRDTPQEIEDKLRPDIAVMREIISKHIVIPIEVKEEDEGEELEKLKNEERDRMAGFPEKEKK